MHEMQPYDRVPPQNLGAERAVLGACLLEHEALGIALEILKPEDFYDLKHRSAFEVMFDMYAASSPVDLVTLTEEVMKRGFSNAWGDSLFSPPWWRRSRPPPTSAIMRR